MHIVIKVYIHQNLYYFYITFISTTKVNPAHIISHYEIIIFKLNLLEFSPFPPRRDINVVE